jgi:hypothetical protein
MTHGQKNIKLGNNYLEETDSSLFRDNIQKCTGEVKGLGVA